MLYEVIERACLSFFLFPFVSLFLLFFSFLLISAAFTSSDILKLVILSFVQFLKLVLVSEIDGQTS